MYLLHCCLSVLHRTLLHNSNGVPEEDSTRNADSSSENSGGKDDPMKVVQNVVILLLAGIAIVIALVLLSYLVAMVADRCARGFRPTSTAHDEIIRNDNSGSSAISRKANLWGLKLSERERILQKVFESTTFAYSEQDVVSQQTNRDSCITLGDIEMGRIRKREPSTVHDATTDDNDTELKTEICSEDEKDASVGASNVDDPALLHNRTQTSSATAETNSSEQNQGDAVVSEQNNLHTEQEQDDGRMCSICLNQYLPGESVMTGTQCRHLFHTSCCQTWLLQHDHCPYCRKAMVTSTKLRQAAVTVLGERRVAELSMTTRVSLSAAAVSLSASATVQDSLRPARWWRRSFTPEEILQQQEQSNETSEAGRI